MKIFPASNEHIQLLSKLDRHIAETELRSLTSRGRILIAAEDERLCGWLRWNLFWDNTPFMNMLFVLEAYRGAGLGKALVQHWEGQMKANGYYIVMTSTSADEYAQHFYQKLGYEAIGGFVPPGEVYELILAKRQ